MTEFDFILNYKGTFDTPYAERYGISPEREALIVSAIQQVSVKHMFPTAGSNVNELGGVTPVEGTQLLREVYSSFQENKDVCPLNAQELIFTSMRIGESLAILDTMAKMQIILDKLSDSTYEELIVYMKQIWPI